MSYANDVAYLVWDSAFVYDPSGSTDIPDLLEFANAQYLELRYYDGLLEQAIVRMYEAIEDANTKPGISKLGIITPLGGLCFLAGWLCLGLAAWRLG